MTGPMGDSAASHEGAEYLKPHPKDGEVLMMTRRDLRIFADRLLNIASNRFEKQIDQRIDARLKDHVHLETVL